MYAEDLLKHRTEAAHAHLEMHKNDFDSFDARSFLLGFDIASGLYNVNTSADIYAMLQEKYPSLLTDEFNLNFRKACGALCMTEDPEYKQHLLTLK